MEKKKFYITTPIYYPSDKLHIGHTYCTVARRSRTRPRPQARPPRSFWMRSWRVPEGSSTYGS